MKTVSRPEWKLVPHSKFQETLAEDIKEVFTECHMTAQVIWDRNGPAVVFVNDEDAEEFGKRF